MVVLVYACFEGLSGYFSIFYGSKIFSLVIYIKSKLVCHEELFLPNSVWNFSYNKSPAVFRAGNKSPTVFRAGNKSPTVFRAERAQSNHHRSIREVDS